MSTAPDRLQDWNVCWLGELAPDEVHLYLCSLDWEQASLDWAEGVLSAAEKARAVRLVDPVRRSRFTAARASLRWLLAKHLHQLPHDVMIQYAPGGKPYVPGVHFNVSHSHDRALIAITKACSLGVDMEFIDPYVSYWQVAEVGFTSQEREALSAISVEQQRQVFYQMWTSKESLMKAHGCEFDIHSLAKEAPDFRATRVFPLSLEEDWAGALALTKPSPDTKLLYRFLV
jgi:4'-phosphopantetheinyl transferase